MGGKIIRNGVNTSIFDLLFLPEPLYDMKFYCCILFLWLLPSTFCYSQADKKAPGPATVLIFDSIPKFTREVRQFSNLTHVHTQPQAYIRDNFYTQGINPRSRVKDTIVLYPKGGYIVLSFFYSMMHQPFDYVIRKGDTVTIRFRNDMSYATSTDQGYTDYLNHEYSRRMAGTPEHTPYEIYINYAIVAKSLNELMNNEPTAKADWYPKARNYLLNELRSLSEMPGLSGKYPMMFNFFQDKLTYLVKRLDFEQNKLPADSLRDLLRVNKTMPSDMPYSYFLPFLETVARKNIVSRARVFKYEHGNIVDYREVYDKVSAWDEINDLYRKQLLYGYLKEIGTGFSVTDFNKYLSRFSSFTNDTILIKEIRQEFPAPYDITSQSGDSLLMLDARGNQTDLQTFVAQNKGKVIYIDFWASWCVPCRSEMKSGEALRKKFKDKDVVFAYFSIDRQKSQWTEAYNADKLNELPHNYILLNWGSSRFLKSIGFGPIPRHLLYDKSGRLVHKNAPGPGSAETARLLEQYVSQKSSLPIEGSKR